MKELYRKLLFFSIVFLICLQYRGEIAYGENVIKIEDGALTFITNDTKAASGIKWKTAGFTITDKPCLGANGNGGYPAKYNHAVIMIEQEDIDSTDLGNGIIRSKFYLPETELSKILVDSGFGDTVKEGGTLYLNCIFQVTKNGIDYGPLLYDLQGITNAQPWRNPDDFYDRFDIKVVYKGINYPVKVEYRLEDETIIKTFSGGKYKAGTVFNVALDKELSYKNEEYELVTSYYLRNYNYSKRVSCKLKDYGYGISDIAAVSGKMPIDGVKVVGVYRKSINTEPNKEIIEFEGGLDGECEGKIGSNYWGKEIYETDVRIPSGESLYVYANAPSYIYKGELVKKTETIVQKVNITIPYLLKWQEKTNVGGETVYKDMEERVKITKEVVVETDVSYWVVDSIQVKKAKKLVVNNELLSDKEVSIDVSNSSEIGDETIDCLKKTDNNVTYNKNVEDVTLKEITVSGKNSRPDIPSYNYLAAARNYVGDIYVANDKLVIGKKEIMGNEKRRNNTQKPQNYESIGNKRSIAYKIGYIIAKSVDNGGYDSEGTMNYVTVLHYNSEELIKKKELQFNKVNVHTPVVCDGKVSTQNSQSQLIDYDKSKAVLILDSTFMVDVSCKGNHVDSMGYGYRDYLEYVDAIYVEFPFEVVIEGKTLKKGEWYKLKNCNIEVYLPSNVGVGDYQIKFYSKSINCKDKKNLYEKIANKNQKNYYAYDTVNVTVAGRVYNFNIYDISDYPLWEKVFRDQNRELNGTRYRAGLLDYNKNIAVRDSIYTLPLRNGSHPYVRNKGAQKSGYSYKMYVDTLGDYGKDDSIWIVPKFYYVSYDGKTRKEVDLYYSETININGIDKKYYFIKVGSELDKKNIKYLWGRKAFTYGNIMIPATFSRDGKTSKDVTFKRWYFRYYLPSEIYMVKKDTVLNKNEYFGESSSYIYKDGYLVINFDIEVIRNGSRYLSYENKINSSYYNCCNMWKQEGMPLKITDSKGTVYNISYGDIMFINNNESAGRDYLGGGTH